MPITETAVLVEWQRGRAREETGAGVVLAHGRASGVALAWELQLLTTAAKAGR